MTYRRLAKRWATSRPICSCSSLRSIQIKWKMKETLFQRTTKCTAAAGEQHWETGKGRRPANVLLVGGRFHVQHIVPVTHKGPQKGRRKKKEHRRKKRGTPRRINGTGSLKWLGGCQEVRTSRWHLDEPRRYYWLLRLRTPHQPGCARQSRARVSVRLTPLPPLDRPSGRARMEGGAGRTVNQSDDIRCSALLTNGRPTWLLVRALKPLGLIQPSLLCCWCTWSAQSLKFGPGAFLFFFLSCPSQVVPNSITIPPSAGKIQINFLLN